MDTEELIGRYAIGVDKPEDYIKWAEEQLADGFSSTNLAILAGLDLEKPIDTSEVREYFSKCTRDLGIQWPDERSAQRRLSEKLSLKIIADELDPQAGLSMLAKLYIASGYSVPYSIWDELEEDISSLETDYGPIFNIGINKNNVNEYIKNVAAQYLKIISRDLPSEFFSLVYCPKCGLIAQPNMKRIDNPRLFEKLYRFLFRRVRGHAYRQECRKCGSGGLISMRSYEGREKYLSTVTG